MRITIYDDTPLIGNTLSCCLQDNKSYGPGVYRWMWDQLKTFYETGSTVEKNLVHPDRETVISNGYLDTLQRMDNETLDDQGNITFLDGFFEKWEEKFEHVVWSNWWGSISHKHAKFVHHDRLVFAHATKKDMAMHYACTKILNPIIDEDHIDLIVDNWRMDHVLVHGKDVGNWSDIWFTHFHDKVKQDFQNGKLKYFYQLNRLNWHVFKKPFKDVKMYTVDDARQVVLTMYHEHDDQHIERYIKQHPECISIDLEWYKDINRIQDYLEVSFDRKQLNNLNKLEAEIEIKKEYFQQQFPDLG
jgi:hypothetical protein